MKQFFFILISVVFLISAFFLGSAIKKNMYEFKQLKQLYANELNIKETLFDVKEYLFPSEVLKTEMSSGVMLNKANIAKEKGITNTLFLVVISAIYLFMIAILLFLKKFNLKQLGIATLLVSFVFLILGIFIPMLEMSAFLDGIDIKADKMNLSEIPYIGEFLPNQELDLSQKINGKMYGFYQCKSISDLISLLFESKNYVVGIAILLFSFVFPFLKLALSILFILSKSVRNKKLFVDITSYIGKFSMADVFVVAIFLAYLSLNNMNTGITTESTILIGFYLFLTYCILSILVFFIIKNLTKRAFIEGCENEFPQDNFEVQKLNF